jgi:hypothetical protein
MGTFSLRLPQAELIRPREACTQIDEEP